MEWISDVQDTVCSAERENFTTTFFFFTFQSLRACLKLKTYKLPPKSSENLFSPRVTARKTHS